MVRNTKQAIPFVQQQLLEAIDQIKDGASHDDILPKLEAVMQQLQTLATHDHLTGALNRQTLVERLDAELQRSGRTGHTFAVALIGIDHLLETMEVHGQEVTKRILQVVTGEAAHVLRALDSFGRVGVTEFAIVMPTTWIEQGEVAIQRLQLRLAHFAWNDIAQGLQVSFCTGLTQNAPGDQAEMVLQRAATALQQARQLGGQALVQILPDLPDLPGMSSL